MRLSLGLSCTILHKVLDTFHDFRIRFYNCFGSEHKPECDSNRETDVCNECRPIVQFNHLSLVSDSLKDASFVVELHLTHDRVFVTSSNSSICVSVPSKLVCLEVICFIVLSPKSKHISYLCRLSSQFDCLYMPI